MECMVVEDVFGDIPQLLRNRSIGSFACSCDVLTREVFRFDAAANCEFSLFKINSSAKFLSLSLIR